VVTDALNSGHVIPKDGTWHHVVVVHKGDEVEIWVNGESKARKATNVTTIALDMPINIGRTARAGGVLYFKGLIDEVRIYGRALTEGEITRLYNLKFTRLASATNKLQNITDTSPLVGWYTVKANWTGDQNYTSSEHSWIMSVCEQIPPLWKVVEINQTKPHINETLSLAVDVKDNWYLDTVWLATNETWVWQNRTFRLFHLAGGWVNFTWRNGSIPAGIKVGWQIYFNDSFGNVNATPVRTFEVQIAKTWENFTLDRVWSSAATGDVDADGVLDAVIGAHDGNVYMLEGRRGVRKWNFSTAGYVGSSPSLADLNGDGRLEVYVGSADRRLYALDYDGSLLWNYTTKGVVWSSPAIADVDGDGQNEIIIGSDDNSTYVINATGQQLWNFTTNDTIWSSPVTWKDVIIIASYDRYVYALNGSTREPLWSFAALAQVESTPIVTDVTGDGVPEIAFGSYDRRVYLLDFNGNELWNYTTGGWVTASPNAADLDGDGVAEIIIGSHDSRVYAFKGNGSLLWAFTIPTGGRIESSPSIGDMDLDGDDDVVFGSSDNYVYVVTNEGQLLWSFDTGGYVFSTPALIDLNGDGLLDVVYGNLAATVHALGVPG
jgi:outer membrane protein assembly factor BamB